MAQAAFKPLVLIPSYNTGGALLKSTVEGALAVWPEVWVVVDGSTDGSDQTIEPLIAQSPGARILRLPENRGKGAAVLAGAQAALEAGYTHALTMDSDGQHPASSIVPMMQLAEKHPECLIAGQPEFGPEVPKVRLYGRQITIFWTNLETLGGGLGDTLFGMRIYPLAPLVSAFGQTPWGRGFDFDPEIAVRMHWQGVKPKQIPVHCKYLSKEEQGVSHFHYLRDNLKMIWLHTRLVPEFLLLRIWAYIFRR